MAKGMKRAIFFNQDPTYKAVVAIMRNEEREKKAAPWRVSGILMKVDRENGYELEKGFKLRDRKTGKRYISGKGWEE